MCSDDQVGPKAGRTKCRLDQRQVGMPLWKVNEPDIAVIMIFLNSIFYVVLLNYI